MTIDELNRLHQDHPDWLLLSPQELYRRYWMYDTKWVAMARLAASWRILTAPITRALESLLNRLTH